MIVLRFNSNSAFHSPSDLPVHVGLPLGDVDRHRIVLVHHTLRLDEKIQCRFAAPTAAADTAFFGGLALTSESNRD